MALFARRLLVVACIAAAGFASVPAQAAWPADFEREAPSGEARHLADWVLHSRDHGGQPFVVVDKVRARVFVFDGAGKLRGAAPALLGLATGDTSVAGIGLRALSSIRPEERTTPAGRYLASLDLSLQGDEILWVDYEGGVALHTVPRGLPKDRRLQRMASLKPSEHRITFGCINVLEEFFTGVVAPLFRGRPGVVYVLPESRDARGLFGSYDVAPDGSGPPGGAQPAQ
jgi:hypothetical protein